MACRPRTGHARQCRVHLRERGGPAARPGRAGGESAWGGAGGNGGVRSAGRTRALGVRLSRRRPPRAAVGTEPRSPPGPVVAVTVEPPRPGRRARSGVRGVPRTGSWPSAVKDHTVGSPQRRRHRPSFERSRPCPSPEGDRYKHAKRLFRLQWGYSASRSDPSFVLMLGTAPGAGSICLRQRDAPDTYVHIKRNRPTRARP